MLAIEEHYLIQAMQMTEKSKHVLIVPNGMERQINAIKSSVTVGINLE